MTDVVPSPVLSVSKEDALAANIGEFGYEAFAESCRAEFQRAGGSDFDLVHAGFERFPLLSTARADKVLSILKKEEADPQSHVDRGGGLAVTMLRRPEMVRMILTTLITQDVDQRLTALFRSEYRIKWFSCQKVSENSDNNVSFLWHKDIGPEHHAKMIVYLSDTEETGGRTDFIDADTTEKIRHAGYDYVARDDRFEDMLPFAKERGIPLTVHDAPFARGEAVIFEPTQVLHRGIKPNIAPRYTITLCILPHDKPWTTWMESVPALDLQHQWATNWETHRPWIPSSMP